MYLLTRSHNSAPKELSQQSCGTSVDVAVLAMKAIYLWSACTLAYSTSRFCTLRSDTEVLQEHKHTLSLSYIEVPAQYILARVKIYLLWGSMLSRSKRPDSGFTDCSYLPFNYSLVSQVFFNLAGFTEFVKRKNFDLIFHHLL